MKKKNNKRIQKLNGSLSHSAETALKKYFKTLNGQKPNDLYKFRCITVEEAQKLRQNLDSVCDEGSIE